MLSIKVPNPTLYTEQRQPTLGYENSENIQSILDPYPPPAGFHFHFDKLPQIGLYVYLGRRTYINGFTLVAILPPHAKL